MEQSNDYFTGGEIYEALERIISYLSSAWYPEMEANDKECINDFNILKHLEEHYRPEKEFITIPDTNDKDGPDYEGMELQP